MTASTARHFGASSTDNATNPQVVEQVDAPGTRPTRVPPHRREPRATLDPQLNTFCGRAYMESFEMVKVLTLRGAACSRDILPFLADLAICGTLNGMVTGGMPVARHQSFGHCAKYLEDYQKHCIKVAPHSHVATTNLEDEELYCPVNYLFPEKHTEMHPPEGCDDQNLLRHYNLVRSQCEFQDNDFDFHLASPVFCNSRVCSSSIKKIMQCQSARSNSYAEICKLLDLFPTPDLICPRATVGNAIFRGARCSQIWRNESLTLNRFTYSYHDSLFPNSGPASMRSVLALRLMALSVVMMLLL